MAVVEANIKAQIKQILIKLKDEKNMTPEQAADYFAGELSVVIANAIRSATITYTTGLITPTGGGPVTGSFGHTIQ